MPRQGFLVGNFYFLGEDEDDLLDGEITEAIVTRSRIALTWDEEAEAMNANLHSVDGTFYQGIWGSRTEPNIGEIEGWLYRSEAGDYLFWGKWENLIRGSVEHNVVHLSED